MSETEHGRHQLVEAQIINATVEPGPHCGEAQYGHAGLTYYRHGRLDGNEAQSVLATATPALFELEPNGIVPGSPLHQNGRQQVCDAQLGGATVEPGQRDDEAQLRDAGLTNSKTVARSSMKTNKLTRPSSPATGHVKPNELLPGSLIPNGRRKLLEAHYVRATAEPGQLRSEIHYRSAGLTNSKTVAKYPLKSCRAVRPSSPARDLVKPSRRLPGSPLSNTVAISSVKPQTPVRPSSPATTSPKPSGAVPGSPIYAAKSASMRPY